MAAISREKAILRNHTKEKYKHIIEILGEEKINELYFLFGSEKISLVTLRKILWENRVRKSLNGKKSIAQIAKENGVVKMTIYRLLKIKSQK